MTDSRLSDGSRQMTIRPARVEDAPGLARVHVDSWRTTYQGVVPDAYLAALSYERREQMWHTILQMEQGDDAASFTYIAEDETGRVVAFVNGGRKRTGISGYDGELYAIYLLAEMQGRGLGRRLVGTLVEQFVRQGMTSMAVVVLADNSARYFYEALGATLLCEQEDEIGGKRLIELVYGWSDIRRLLLS
ncbi:GNAT family N-acetyltransferase [Ktedonobacter robiniae]|uniref:N-acetyltransferase YuaI n=1 Tax=Ktedonobacter robiniae TaxID=2778365 RepID=A0ABQ3UPJ5_9CHLR|nr:GNAT family N-acetyltransferase [Ktedonobacter robiniae]GHO54669.1 putative N-acetyltransferase YuaI [Ktedonobacter robiniae]